MLSNHIPKTDSIHIGGGDHVIVINKEGKRSFNLNRDLSFLNFFIPRNASFHSSKFKKFNRLNNKKNK